jgi:hypothetical protein
LIRRGRGIQLAIRIQNGLGQVRRDLALADEHLDLLAHLEDGLGFDDVGLGF